MPRVRSLVVWASLCACSGLAYLTACSSFSADEPPAVTPEASTPDGDVAGEGGTSDGGPGADGGGPSLHVVYAHDYGSTTAGGPATIYPAGMVVDSSGGVVLTGGYANAPVDVGGVTLPDPPGSAADAYLLHLDGAGAHVASKVFGDSQGQGGAAVAGSASQLFASFIFAGTVDLSAGQQVSSDGAGGNLNSLVARFGSAFTVADHVPFKGTQPVLVKHLAAGASGSVIAFGDWTSGISVNGGSTNTRGGGGTGLTFVRAFTLDNKVIIHNDYCPDPTTCVAGAIGSNVSGESLAGGRFSGTLTDPAGSASLVTAAGDDDAYLLKLDALLERQWVVQLGGSGTQEVLAVAAVPKTSDFIVAGTFDGAFKAPGEASIPSSGFTDIFVVRVGDKGKIVWSKTFGGPGADVARAVAVDADANVFLVGDFYSPKLDLGGGALVNADAVGVGSRDAFVAWFDGAGKHVYSARFGDGKNDSAAAVGVDGSGNVVVTGTFEGAIDFGGGALQARGASDMFVAKLGR